MQSAPFVLIDLGYPNLLMIIKMKRGDLDYQISDQGISFLKWKDNRSEHFLSNYHGNDTCKVQRRLKDGTKIDVTAPVVVKTTMDTWGELIKPTCYVLFVIGTGNRKNGGTGFFFAILEMAYVNSYIAYVEVRREKMSSLEYKRCITKGLLTKSKPQPKRKGRPKSNGDEQTFCAKKRKKNLSVSNDVRLKIEDAIGQHSCRIEDVVNSVHSKIFNQNHIQNAQLIIYFCA
ncbi:hypothetical protein AVEN_59806-1 [Araneus ventricosus]|uniref:PiggyBac transposable element-derived protein domain-containing protein n=1 Tax=Araneus ventricosus TaxID=182803 RepID=A0A4Y2W9X7_ARAVE|nr:hypothetical protein AVEN_59806-1 [Araneus ventricosus]